MSARSIPTQFAFVTGHAFGEATFCSILSLPEYGIDLECCLLGCLDHTKAAGTVGFNDLGPLARNKGIRTEYIRSIKTETSKQLLTEVSPDYLFIVGWSELAPASVLDIPRQIHGGISPYSNDYGSIGIHPSLLPEGRGRAPIPWAIIKGLTRTGVTAFLLEQQADAGGIIEQIEVPLDAEETATTLFEKARLAHSEIGVRLGRIMATRSLHAAPQNENLATVWPRRRPADGEIDFSSTGEAIDRLVRALTPPYPGAFIVYHGVRVRVHKVRPISVHHSALAGTIISADQNRPMVAIPAGAVSLERFEPANVNFEPGSIITRSPGSPTTEK